MEMCWQSIMRDFGTLPRETPENKKERETG